MMILMATISEMESGTYYIRAYAVNKAGVGYGEELSVSIHVLTVPVLDRVRIVDWETNRIQCSILNAGGSKITANGFAGVRMNIRMFRIICWKRMMISWQLWVLCIRVFTT